MRMYRSRTWVLAVATVVAGCATAKPGANGGGADARPDSQVIGGRPDARPIPDAPPGTPDASPPDAMVPVPDAMPGVVTMTQANSNTITAGNALSCNDGSPFFDTAENSYYRAFKVSDYGVSGTLHITKVDFGIESAAADGASQSVTVKLYTYTGATGTTLDTAQMTLIGSKSVTVPNTTTGEMLTASIAANVPSSATVVAEVFVPDGTAAFNSLFIGSNKGGETQPGYIRAPTCSTTTPTAFGQLAGSPVVDIIVSVTGSYP